MRHPLTLPTVDRLAASFGKTTGWSLLRYDQDQTPLALSGPSDVPIVAVHVDQQPVGYLGLARARIDHVLDQPPTELMETVAELIGGWVTALHEARDADEETTSLIEIARLLTSAVGQASVFDVICEATASAVEARAVVLRLLDDDRGTLRTRALFPRTNDRAVPMSELAPVPLVDSLADQMALADGPVTIENSSTDPRCANWPPMVRGSGWALCVPLAGRQSPLGTLLIACHDHQGVSAHTMRLIQAIANQAANCIEQSRLEHDQLARQTLKRDIDAASEIQRALLPQRIPEHPRLDLAVYSQSRREIGGDLYDFIETENDQLGIVVGDASGKSVTGAIMMATVRGGIHAFVGTEYDVSDIIARINRTIHNATHGEYFMTLFYGVMDVKNLTLRYVNAGHNPPLCFHGDECIELFGGGLILGAARGRQYTLKTMQLHAGDVLVFYTDGLSEAKNEQRDQFDVSRIREVVRNRLTCSAQEILNSLREAVTEFCGPVRFEDDVTIVVLRVR